MGWATPAGAARTLTLRECHVAALETNPTIRAAEFEPLLAAAEYLAAQGLFDPSVTLNYTVTDRTDPLTTRTILAVQGLVTAIDSTTTIIGGGFGGLLASGAQYTTTFTRTRTDSTINAGFGIGGEYDMELTGTLLQPLLRNFGIGITTTSLQVAGLERTAANARLRSTLIDTLFEVESAYWKLVLAREQLRVQENGRLLAEQLLTETRTRLKVGVVAPLAVLEAETALARREEGVLLAEQAVGDARDALQQLVAETWSVAPWRDPIRPADAPELELVPLDEDWIVADAMRARPEIVQLQVAVEQARLSTAFQKNQRLPEVNLRAEGGWRSVDTNPYDALDSLFSANNPHWLLGVEVSIPWGNREARGGHRRARSVERGAELELRRVRQQIVQDARAAIREVAAQLQQVQATRAAEQLQEEQLRAEEAKLAVGVATPFDVRQKQDDLIDAQGQALEALIAYRISVANLARAQGRYLERIGVQVGVGADDDIAPSFSAASRTDNTGETGD